MSTTWKVIGFDKCMKNLQRKGTQLTARTKKAITDEANTVLKESKIECPVETGTMRRSGTVDNPTISVNKVTVEIGYNTAYAQDVHENLQARHKEGKAKFLEDPVMRAVPGLPGRLAKRLESALYE